MIIKSTNKNDFSDSILCSFAVVAWYQGKQNFTLKHKVELVLSILWNFAKYSLSAQYCYIWYIPIETSALAFASLHKMKFEVDKTIGTHYRPIL